MPLGPNGKEKLKLFVCFGIVIKPVFLFMDRINANKQKSKNFGSHLILLLRTNENFTKKFVRLNF